MEELAKPDRELVGKELSRNSEALWRRTHSRGFLSKALNNKDILYSHAKALSGWQLGRSNLFPDLGPELETTSQPGNLPDRWQHKQGGSHDNLEEVEQKFQPVLQCPVILEDLRRPPEAVEDVRPALFTLYELLSYLRSPEWDEWVCLRVIGGEVLNILNRSLLSLERRRLVNLHSQYALANNRVKVTAAQGRGVQTADEQKAGDIVAPQVIEEIKVKVKDVKKKKKKQETETDNENIAVDTVAEPQGTEPLLEDVDAVKKIPFPKAYQTNPEFLYEQLSIELVFYEKCSRSNIPFIAQDLGDYDYATDLPVPKALPRDIMRAPLSYREYRSDKVRYPAHENIQTKDHIARLELELRELKQKQAQMEEEAQAQAKIPMKEKTKDKEAETKGQSQGEMEEIKTMMAKIPDVEFIANNPFFEEERPKEITRKVSKKEVDKKTSRMREAVQDSNSSEADLKQLMPGDRRKSEASSPTRRSGESSALSSQSRTKVAPEENSSSSHSLMNVSGSDSGSLGSLVSLWEPEEHADETKSHLMQRLYLTNQELYISSLYEGREENRRTTEKKLEERRRAWDKKRALTAQQTLQAAVRRARIDLYSSFKHLARKKEVERRIATRPRVKQLNLFPATRVCPGEPTNKTTLQNKDGKLKPLHAITSKDLQLSYAQKSLPEIASCQRTIHQTKNSENSVTSPAKVKCPKGPNWEVYRKAEDMCEMESSLQNDLERGLLHRMPTTNFYPNYQYSKQSDLGVSKLKVGTKREKNKSQNMNSDKNNNLPNSYHSYDFFRSAYGERLKITDSVLKANRRRRSFYVDGLKEGYMRRPTISHIGFRNPEHLIKYLVNIHSFVHNSQQASWRPRTSDDCLYRARTRKAKLKKVQKTLSRQNAGQKYAPQSEDANNSSFRLGPLVSKPPKLARMSSRRRSSAGGRVYRNQALVVDRNKSANPGLHLPSEDVLVDEIPEAHGDDLGAEHEAKFEDEEEAEDSIDLAMTASELLEQDLQSYRGTCTCDECEGQYAMLAHLKPRGNIFTELHGCPPVLGRLRRDYRFLQSQKESVMDRLDQAGRVALPERPPVLSVIEVGEKLLELMDDVMIRREILYCSRGFVYTTITFTKRTDRAGQTWATAPC